MYCKAGLLHEWEVFFVLYVTARWPQPDPASAFAHDYSKRGSRERPLPKTSAPPHKSQEYL